MASIIYTVILVASFLFLQRKKDDPESNFPWKIIGYFILGSFAFNLNQVSLPLGFILYLLFFRPKLNIHVKRLAAVFGVVSFILVHWILPFTMSQWEFRSVNIGHELSSVYTMNFQDEYELIKQKLELENDFVKLGDFDVEYVEAGSINQISWQLVRQADNSFYLYQIRYDPGKSRYQVNNTKTDTWLQYNRLIDADHFFENLNLLDIKDLTRAKGNFSYYVIRSSGERTFYAADQQTNFLVANGEIQSLDNEQLPVKAYIISTFAMKKTGEEKDDQGRVTQQSFEGTESADFLFDVEFQE